MNWWRGSISWLWRLICGPHRGQDVSQSGKRCTRPGSIDNMPPELRSEYRDALDQDDWREMLKAADEVHRKRQGVKK